MVRDFPMGLMPSFRRIIRTALLLLSLAAVLFIPGCNSDDNTLDPELADALRDILTDNMEEFGVPGALAGVWMPGKGRLILEEGVSNIETGEPIMKEDHMRIGSVTKSFTVTVILQLAEEGLLSLDDRVGDYIPGIENGDATIVELADMRSGIFNYSEDGEFVMEFVSSNFLRVWTYQELVDIADGNPPYFPHGEGWHYSNTNTVILGMIIEKVTGNPVGEEIRERIIKPLGLGGTFYPETPDMPEPFAHGYGFDPIQDISFTDPSSSAGSGAMISKLTDLKKWGRELGQGTLLDEEFQAIRVNSLMPIVFNPCDDQDPEREKRSCPEYDRYGLGIGELSGWKGHTGEYIGYTALVMHDPESGSTVVILMNVFGVGEHIPTKVFREFAEVLGDALQK